MSLRWPSVILALLFFQPSLAAQQPGAAQPKPRLDQYGDPLPEHAVLRIGTNRLRPSGPVTAIRFTPDAKRLVTVNVLTGIQYWNVENGKEISVPDLPQSAGNCAISTDGRLAAIVSPGDLTCRIYDIAAGKQIQTLQGAMPIATIWAFSPDGSLLACAGHNPNPSLFIWKVSTGAPLIAMSLSIEERAPTALAFSPDNKIIANAAAGWAVAFWDVGSGRLLGKANEAYSILGHSRLTFAADSLTASAIALGDADNSICRWNAIAGRAERYLPKPAPARHVGFTPDAKSYLTWSAAEGIQFWNMDNDRHERTLPGMHNGVFEIAFSADEKLMAVVDMNNVIRITEVATGKLLHDFAAHTVPGSYARFTTDGKAIVSSTNQGLALGSYKFWAPATGNLTREVPWQGNAFLSGDGRVFAMNDGTIRIRDLAASKSLPDKIINDKSRFALQNILAISEDGRFLATIAASIRPELIQQTTINIWDTDTGATVMTLPHNSSGLRHVRFMENNRYFAVFARNADLARGLDLFLTLWDRVSRRKASPSPASLVWQDRSVFSRSGRLMASPLPGVGLKIVVTELATGRPAFECEIDKRGNHLGSVLAFSADAKMIATTPAEGGILLWDLFQARPITQLAGHRGRVSSLSFSPDGKQLVSGSADDNSLLVWDVSAWTLVAAKAGDQQGQALAELWDKLSHGDPQTAYATLGRLLQTPREAVALIRTKLQPAAPADAKEIGRLIDALDSKRFAERDQAMARLAKLGEQAQAALENTLLANPPLEVRQRIDVLLTKLDGRPWSAQLLQSSRALELLEMLATAEAVELLESLAGGAAHAWLTREAADSLQRVRKRSAFSRGP